MLSGFMIGAVAALGVSCWAPGEGPRLSTDALEEARRLAPGADVYALEADWRGWWVTTGRPRLRSPDAAFLGWVRSRGGKRAGG